MNSLLVTIVLYKQSFNDTPSVKSIETSLSSALEKGMVFVYDNSPIPQQIQSEIAGWKIIYKHNPKNDGISKGYNESAELAKELGKEWLLFIDQDSVFPVDYLQSLESAINENKNTFIFAPILKSGARIISPNWVFLEKGLSMKIPITGNQPMKFKSFINSGLCVRLTAFNKVGGYNDKIRLDFSDTYFVNKLKRAFNQIYVLDMIVEHSLSTFSDNYNSQLIRFRYYCNGARNFSNIVNFFPILGICSFRAIKLSLLSKNMNFFTTYLQYYILGKSL
ncbi:glycosyltransferase [Pedobacter chinensis]|nr:glycosyltransferase [Pedobacter chinensis]